MPNYLLCDQFRVRTPVLHVVYTCMASISVKSSWFKRKRYESLVVCVGLFGLVLYTILC